MVDDTLEKLEAIADVFRKAGHLVVVLVTPEDVRKLPCPRCGGPHPTAEDERACIEFYAHLKDYQGG
jgi:hypothetical protein